MTRTRPPVPPVKYHPAPALPRNEWIKEVKVGDGEKRKTEGRNWKRYGKAMGREIKQERTRGEKRKRGLERRGKGGYDEPTNIRGVQR